VASWIGSAVRATGIAFYNVYRNVFQPVSGFIGTVVHGIGTVFRNVFNGISTTVHNVFNGIVNFLRPIVNTIGGIVKSVIGAINTVTGAQSSVSAGAVTSRFGNLAKPHMALGGVVTRPTTILAGESGPEAIIPLHYGANTPGLGGGGGGVTVQISVPGGFVGNERQLTQQIMNAFVTAIRSGAVNPNDFKNALGV
jgi:hypothetical protein